MKLCPWEDCGTPLVGLERFCFACERYAEDWRPEGEKAAPVRDDPRLEKEIERSVINSLKAMGLAVWKLSQPRETMQTEGIADLFCTGRGITLWCEVKTATGTQSEDQVAFELAVVTNGGNYAVLRHEADVAELIDRLTRGLKV